jgi:hypothetical protein
MHVAQIVVIGERKGVKRFKPAVICKAPLVGFSDFDHFSFDLISLNKTNCCTCASNSVLISSLSAKDQFFDANFLSKISCDLLRQVP